MKDNISRIQAIATKIDEDFDKFFGAVTPPIYENTIYRYPDFESVEAVNKGNSFRYSYGKNKNPTLDAVECKLSQMEKGEAAKCFASGTAAMYTALTNYLEKDDHVVTIKNVYGRIKNFLNDTFTKYGIHTTFVDGKDPKEFEESIRHNTKIIYLESPSTWQLELQDLKAVADIARKHNIKTIIDNTWATPVFQNPMEFGIDMVIHSASKYLGGHSDLVAGVIVASREVINNLPQLGGVLSPYEAGKLMKGLRTLAMRMERHQSNAIQVAKLLEKNSKVSEIRYPGLESYDQFDLANKQMHGFSGLMSFVLECGRDGEKRFINALKHISIGGSWGGFESIIYPIDANESIYDISQMGYKPRQIRLSVGLESIDTVLSDIENALNCI